MKYLKYCTVQQDAVLYDFPEDHIKKSTVSLMLLIEPYLPKIRLTLFEWLKECYFRFTVTVNLLFLISYILTV